MKPKRILQILTAVLFILMIPYLAMQFSDEINWTFSDFMLAGILLISTGVAIDIAIRKIRNKNLRIGMVVAIIVGLVIVWGVLSMM